jgi:hypothetical protein
MSEAPGSNITFDWDNLRYPVGLNTRNYAGEYRIVETQNDIGESRFTPEYRNYEDGDWWQKFEVRVPSRISCSNVVWFSTLDRAQEWIDAAHYRRPFLAYHKYEPAEY